MKWMRFAALAGNTLFILWIIYNGIDEGWKGVRLIEAMSLIGLVILLALNSVLLWKKG